jgi:hypothetical protein
MEDHLATEEQEPKVRKNGHQARKVLIRSYR